MPRPSPRRGAYAVKAAAASPRPCVDCADAVEAAKDRARASGIPGSDFAVHLMTGRVAQELRAPRRRHRVRRGHPVTAPLTPRSGIRLRGGAPSRPRPASASTSPSQAPTAPTSAPSTDSPPAYGSPSARTATPAWEAAPPSASPPAPSASTATRTTGGERRDRHQGRLHRRGRPTSSEATPTSPRMRRASPLLSTSSPSTLSPPSDCFLGTREEAESYTDPACECALGLFRKNPCNCGIHGARAGTWLAPTSRDRASHGAYLEYNYLRPLA
jgi:hypothetical protein